MRVFEITTPDTRKVRHVGETAEAVQAKLLPGYTVTGEVVAYQPDMSGGYVIPIGGGESPLAALLKMHGADMRAWLKAEGVVFAAKGD